jgi:hypothetical protein
MELGSFRILKTLRYWGSEVARPVCFSFSTQRGEGLAMRGGSTSDRERVHGTG